MWSFSKARIKGEQPPTIRPITSREKAGEGGKEGGESLFIYLRGAEVEILHQSKNQSRLRKCMECTKNKFSRRLVTKSQQKQLFCKNAKQKTVFTNQGLLK